MSRLTANEIIEHVYDEATDTLKTSLSATPTIDIGDVTLLAGTALIGKVGIDQVTANANEVVLKASAANVGKVDPNTATPTIYNVTLTNANTEYSQALPANCRGFEFQCQTGVQCRWSNVTGKVATPTAPFMTLRPNAWYASPPINQGASPSTLYFGSATAGSIIELIAYV